MVMGVGAMLAAVDVTRLSIYVSWANLPLAFSDCFLEICTDEAIAKFMYCAVSFEKVVLIEELSWTYTVYY